MAKRKHKQPSAWRELLATINWRRISVATTVVCVLSVSAIALHRLAADPRVLPMRKVDLNGEFQRVDAERVMAVVRATACQTFFACELEALQSRIEALPWVYRATVQRRWPDRVVVGIVEQEAFARWNDNGLLNVHGELFMPPLESFPQGLPLLIGPQGTHGDVARRYQKLAQSLAKAGLYIDKVELSARRSWSLALHNGMELLLGREIAEGRVYRFVRAYQRVVNSAPTEIRRVDLRYPNGFAVTWKDEATANSGKQMS